jgi:homoserine O-acetyltransferase
LRFPLITIRDIVMAQRILLEHLGVPHLAMVAGGSLGGQQALEWVVTYPDFVDKVAVIAATAALTAQAIAFNEVARQTILADVAWLCGDYLPDQGPHTGLAIARMLATITYQSEEGMESRFARNLPQREEVSSPTGSPDFGCRFDIENYLYHQGNLFTQRFDANSYLYLTRAMDLYTLEQRFSSLDEAICHLRSKALFIGIDSDFLFPAARVHWLAEKICHLGGDAQYIELRSPHGHDAFLKEWGQMADALHVLFK